MVSDRPPRRLPAESVARWLATVAAALLCAVALLATPFGCAVGEYEEDRSCDPAAASWLSVAALALTIVLSRVTRRRSVHWAGLAVTAVLALSGASQA